MQYCDVFPSVSQRVAAYKYHCERYGKRCRVDDDTLDDIYRFLFQSFNKDDLEFYAKKEGMTVDDYIDSVSFNNEVIKELKELK